MSILNKHDISFDIKVSGTPTVFRVVGFECDEMLSKLFTINITIACRADSSINPADMIDKMVDLSIHHKYDQLIASGVYDLPGIPVPVRYFNGVIESVEHLSTGNEWSMFQISVMPTLHRLRHTSDCRIFQKDSVVDIVKKVFGDHGIKDFIFNVKDPHQKRDYCVQYNETHLGFIQRLLAEEGIFYYFRHEKGMHELVLTDFTQGSTPLKPVPTVEFHDTSGGMIKRQYISQFNWRETLRTNEVRQREYCFTVPKYDQDQTEKISTTPDGIKAPDYQKYQYHARYKHDSQGKPFTKYQVESQRADASQGGGSSNLTNFSAGRKFTLKEHTIDANNREYLLVSVSHSGTQPQALDGASGGGSTTYNNSFTVVADVATPSWRPPMLPKPVIHGSQIAHVVGPPGEEIYTDKYGRVKLYFPWDFRSTKDDKSSCWVRVSQAWAGKGWGFVSIPRIGQEVIVDYLEGDPDQPIVVGRTYHEGNMPPYSLPGNKTQTGLKSRSSKGGSAANFNEMRFEDLKGKEQVYIQAEKNQDNLVKNDETTDVWHDRTEHIGHDESITIDNDRTEVVHHDETITIDNDRTETVHHDEQIRIDNNRSKSIGVNESIDIGNNRDESVGNNESWSVGNNQNTSVGNSQSLKVGKKQSINIGKSKMETIGVSNMLSVGAGMQVSVGAVLNTTVGISNTEQVGFLKHIIAGKQIQFVCGGSSITLNSDGSIKIAGKSIEIAGSDSIKLTSAIIDLN